MARLTDKISVVTGASKGIGASIAKALAREGAKVVVNYATDASAANLVVADIKANGGDAIAVNANIAKTCEIATPFEETKRVYGRVDILVNNAGIFSHAPLTSVTEEEIVRIFATNVKGLLLATKAALPLFPSDGGSIINVGALASVMPSAGLSVYSGSKGAVDVITGSLAKELGPKNIRVNEVLPGFTVTEGLETQGLVGGSFEQRAIAGTPLGRAGRPDDVADIVVFLASAESRWVTGSRINAAGGLSY
jgi:3-oxoacyl-[acyl-carrier protein] reductase